jgi:hypothetical protein
MSKDPCNIYLGDSEFKLKSFGEEYYHTFADTLTKSLSPQRKYAQGLVDETLLSLYGREQRPRETCHQCNKQERKISKNI